MLKALREDGTPLQLLPRLSKEVLKKEKEVGRFYCPECKEKVIMKIGTQRIEHFAHEAGSQCVESYERESMYHLNGKQQLYHWLETQRLQPRLELYYEKLKQRPDLSIKYAAKEHAIEYQCSTIPPELMSKRTNTYFKNNINCIWILGGSGIKRKAEQKVTLSKFDYLFLNKNLAGNWYIPYYCSVSKQFIFLMDIIPIASKKALTKLTIYPLQRFSFQQLLSPNGSSSIHTEDWRNEVRAQKLGIAINGKYYPKFLTELYNHALNISLLPPFIGLPIYNAPIIETSPLIWQTYLFIDQLLHKKANDLITFSEVYRSFMHRIQKDQIKLRYLPLIHNTSPTLPLAEYLRLLVKLEVLEGVNLNTFRLRRGIELPNHVVEGQRLEDQLYKDFQHVLFQHK
ncbi:competence protein CoiA family protein [Niallia sp. XMNu-256]|uniref:competence protein CoiA n=1 Tax=Niallia sp. XMNu-256 TaxID=3082444 RepID=UPI0030D584A0